MPSSIKMIGGALVALLVLIAFLSTYYTVGPQEAVVVTNFGHLSYVAEPNSGLHFKTPFVQNTHSFRVDIQQLALPKLNTYTVDNQEVDITPNVQYRIPAGEVGFVYTNAPDYEALLAKVVVDRIKAAVGQVNVQDVAAKRAELRDTIKLALEKAAKVYGIDIVDFQLTDLEYTQQFRQAVDQAAVQKANVESYKYQLEQQQTQAQTVAVQAEGKANAVKAAAAGDASARLIKAQAEAKAIELEGDAKATAIRAQAQALMANPEYIALIKAQQWDGKLPTNMYAGAPIPFLQLQAGDGGAAVARK